MSTTIQVLAIFGMFFLSYVGLRAFGKPTTRLLFDPDEKRQWNKFLHSQFGSWLTGTNIVGTLTSFATVLVFFLGNAKVFGLWVLICSVSIWLGGYFTNFFTKRIVSLSRVQTLLSSSTQSGGILASLCWSDSHDGKQSAALIKYISLLNIGAVIWLEFALFADIGGEIFGFTSLPVKTAIIAATSFAVIFFVLRYGIRGFAFTDIFQTPVIALSVLVIIAGSLWLAQDASLSISSSLFQPLADNKTILLFVTHVLFLNMFLVLATEPHWLRLWVFQQKETDTQIASTLSTAIIWAVLVGIGLIASALANGAAGTQVIVELVHRLNDLSLVFVVAFWFAAVSALFTTSDAQTYSWLIVKNFNTSTGQLEESRLISIKPLLYALLVSLIFASAYFVVRSYAIPFEKLVFLIIPFSLNTLPAITQLAFNKQPTPAPLVISVILFLILATGGFVQPDNELMWTLTAALAPVVVAVFSPLLGKKLEN